MESGTHSWINVGRRRIAAPHGYQNRCQRLRVRRSTFLTTRVSTSCNSGYLAVSFFCGFFSPLPTKVRLTTGGSAPRQQVMYGRDWGWRLHTVAQNSLTTRCHHVGVCSFHSNPLKQLAKAADRSRAINSLCQKARPWGQRSVGREIRAQVGRVLIQVCRKTKKKKKKEKRKANKEKKKGVFT